MPSAQTKPTKNRRQLAILYFLGLLLATSTALPGYIQSNFLGQFVSLPAISLFFIISNSLTLLAILAFPTLIKKLSNYFLTKVVLILYFISLLGLVLADGPVLALVSFIFFSISLNLIWINMDVLVETFSANISTGRTRTIYFTFINAGWILSPLLTAYLIGQGGYAWPFLIAAGLIIPFFFIFIYHRRKFKDRVKYQKGSLTTTIRKMWRNKNLRGIFFIALLLQLFYSSAVVYIPLYLVNNLGMSWDTLGWIFSIMLIPFLLVEIPAGIIADKYLGEKELLAAGFLILTISLVLFSQITAPVVWLWALILFLSRIGAALIEAMRETYFFKIVDVEAVSAINLFRTTGPLAYIIGPALALGVLAFWPINYIFLFLAIIMLAGVALAASLRDTK